jgi:hypothetical protein
MDVVTDSASALGRRMIDELLERYVAWREECSAVRLAYQCWAQSGRRERRLAYAGYLAALDREEQAARTYAGHVDRVRRWSLIERRPSGPTSALR